MHPFCGPSKIIKVATKHLAQAMLLIVNLQTVPTVIYKEEDSV